MGGSCEEEGSFSSGGSTVEGSFGEGGEVSGGLTGEEGEVSGETTGGEVSGGLTGEVETSGEMTSGEVSGGSEGAEGKLSGDGLGEVGLFSGVSLLSMTAEGDGAGVFSEICSVWPGEGANAECLSCSGCCASQVKHPIPASSKKTNATGAKRRCRCRLL